MAPVSGAAHRQHHDGQAHDVDGVGRAGALDRLDLLAHPVAGAGDVLAGDSHAGRLTRPRMASPSGREGEAIRKGERAQEPLRRRRARAPSSTGGS